LRIALSFSFSCSPTSKSKSCLRYVAPGTLLSVIETKWGLVPDMAGTQLMRHLAREDVVRELTYTARTFSAEEALAYGFATRLVEDPREAANIIGTSEADARCQLEAGLPRNLL
jgi:enoyl-CoA hydratase/carnithine racemase